jgi:hypothetical protein
LGFDDEDKAAGGWGGWVVSAEACAGVGVGVGLGWGDAERGRLVHF